MITETDNPKVMRLLLHICCAPCLLYPLEQLREKNYEVEGVFYNPNIHPFAEYKARKSAVEGLAKELVLGVIYPEYEPREFFQTVEPHGFTAVAPLFSVFRRGAESRPNAHSSPPLQVGHSGCGVNLHEDNPKRCALCWQLRLKKTALAAKERGLGAFTTTLLVSPYQDQELLKSIGIKAGQEEGVEFYYEDFRPGFRKAHDQARAKGIYCQKYCGCLYSEMERYNKK